MTPPDVTVREATRSDLIGVVSVLDGAALSTDLDAIRASVDRGDALVAERASGAGEVVLGALVLDGEVIEGIAVRPRRRGQGIGAALVGAAARRRERVVAEFPAEVSPFYESLGFDVEALPGGERRRGTLNGRA